MEKRPSPNNDNNVSFEPVLKKQKTCCCEDTAFVFIVQSEEPDACGILIADISGLCTEELNELESMAGKHMSEYKPKTKAGRAIQSAEWITEQPRNPIWLHAYRMSDTHCIPLCTKRVIKLMNIWE